jgi:hypothetical protein
MILADLGIAARPRPDHATYIASSLKVLRNNVGNLHRRQQRRGGSRLDARAADRTPSRRRLIGATRHRDGPALVAGQWESAASSPDEGST